jgi:sec-independent protein translocase protein TatC
MIEKPRDPTDDPTPRMTIGEHLDELRKRLFLSAAGLAVSMGLSLIFGKDILRWIEMPFNAAMAGLGVSAQLSVMSVTGVFTTYLKVSLYSGLVLASPWILYQLWTFVGAGLHQHERRSVYLAMPLSAGLFVAGAAFAVVLSIPAIKFFIQFGNDLGIRPIITLDEYVGFMTNLLLAFGAVFQVPLVVLVLAKVGLVDMPRLRRYRAHVIVAMSVIAAVLAPPDLLSMLAMMLPMWLLYELGILLAWATVFRKKPAEADDE